MLVRLGIEKTTALPYHGQSKPVERFFGTLENNFGKLCYGFAGHDAKNRPDYLRKPTKELEKDPNIQSIDEFIQACQNWIDNVYANKIHHGNGMNNRTPNEVYEQEMTEIRTFDNKMELAVICGEHKERVVKHNCIELLGRIYRAKNGELVNYIGKKVTVKYIPENIDRLYVYDEKGRYICAVTASVMTPFRSSTMEDYEEIRRQQKQAKKIVREQMPKARLSVTDSLIQRQVEERDFAREQEAAAAPIIDNEITITTNKRKQSAFQLFNSYSEDEKKKGVM